MRKLLAAVSIAASVFLSNVAIAQIEEVVVTGSRRDEGAPHIFMVKRADHLITTIRVTCDTRDEKQRLTELQATLRGMIAAAHATSTISLGASSGSVVGELDASDVGALVVPDARPDTSQVYVVVKTKVSESDTFNSATRRITDFIDKTSKSGRVEIIHKDSWDLTMIGPDQYRDALVAKIVADAKHTAELFGPGYGVTVEGLERPVSWYQKGPLDLALYIPYTLNIAPQGH